MAFLPGHWRPSLVERNRGGVKIFAWPRACGLRSDWSGDYTFMRHSRCHLKESSCAFAALAYRSFFAFFFWPAFLV
jgi:hypothetical protein